MNKQPIDQARDADLRLSLPALQRAARRARAIARDTGTSLVFSRNGVVELVSPDAAEVVDRVQEPQKPYGDPR